MSALRLLKAKSLAFGTEWRGKDHPCKDSWTLLKSTEGHAEVGDKNFIINLFKLI